MDRKAGHLNAGSRPDTHTMFKPFSWTDLRVSLRTDAAVWLVLMLWLSNWRLLLIGLYVPPASARDLARALFMGARFDSVLASAVVLPTMLLALAAALIGRVAALQAMRVLACGVFSVLAGIAASANLGFFSVYGTQLDQRVMALWNDADGSVRTMIWQAHHPVLMLALGLCMGALMLVSCHLAARLAGRMRPAGPWPRWARVPVLLGIVALMVGLLRGLAWGESPVRVRNAYVTASVELNRTIPSPVAFWLHAMESYGAGAARVPAAQLHDAMAVHRIATHGRGAGADTLATTLSRKAAGSRRSPSHVFVIVLEGQHGFALLPAYRQLGLFPNLARLADQGAWFPLFIPSGRQTDSTLGALVSGTLTPEFIVMQDPGAMRMQLTATASHFNRMRYLTRFYYGGYPGWSRLDEYILAQGFKELHGAGEVPDARGNLWGVWDSYLFDHVLASVDPSRPSFNMILTTTNHSPFNLDAALMPELPELPPYAQAWSDQTRWILRHEMYVDREVGRFVAEAQRRFPGALFVITGDHTAYAAQFSLPGQSPLEQLTVPMLMLGQGIGPAMRGRHDTPASHLDIAPTLYELCAPRGFVYSSIGTDLFSSERPRYAIGQDSLLGQYWLSDSAGEQLRMLPWDRVPPAGAAVDPALVSFAAHHHAAIRVLSKALLGHAEP